MSAEQERAKVVATFTPAQRFCACRTMRVDTSDAISGGMLHGLFHCFHLAKTGQ